MNKKVWDNWLIFLGLTSSYFLGMLGWVSWYQGQVGTILVNNAWLTRLTIWEIFTFGIVWGGIWWQWRRGKFDNKLIRKRLAWLAAISFIVLMIAQVPINFASDNFWVFLNFWQNQAYLWQTIVWAWLMALLIVWFWPFKGSKRFSSILKPSWVIWGMIAVFIIIFGAAGLYLHQNLHTHAFDFGIYDQSVWQLAYHHSTLNTINGYGNAFGAHFQPILFLLAPFYWLWNNPRTLILLEIVIVGLGALPLFRLSLRRFNNLFFSIALVSGYFLFIGNQEALAYPFHPSTLLAPILLFAYDYFDQKRWGWHILFIFLALLVKENAGIYVMTFGVVIILMRRQYWPLGLGYMLAGIGWTAMATKVIIPAISDKAYVFFSYEVLGKNMTQAIETVVVNPVYSLRALMDHVDKVGTLMALLGGSGLLVLASGYGLLVLPNLGEKLWSSREIWTIFAHYGAPMAFGLAIATIEGVDHLQKVIDQRWGLIKMDWLKLTGLMIILVTLALNFNQNVYLKRVIRGDFIRFPEKPALADALKIIPKNASVSAQGIVVAQLAHRSEIYQFPEINRAEYIVITVDGPKYPVGEPGYKDKMRLLLHDKSWGLVYNQGGIAVFTKNKPDKVVPSKQIEEYLNN